MVGNGEPSSAYGSCSVTAGCPYGQWQTTRRNARGLLPSWRSTMSRSLRSVVSLSRSRPAPGVDSLDDEQPLIRPDESEPPRLPYERRSALVERETVA